ncbi:MAG: hypothetical protein FWD61_10315 [Phycisphaerales bacterium]|nr:hypothetical protein [Phycisphaerales bacterium]
MIPPPTDPYERWKQHKASIQPPPDFTNRVMDRLHLFSRANDVQSRDRKGATRVIKAMPDGRSLTVAARMAQCAAKPFRSFRYAAAAILLCGAVFAIRFALVIALIFLTISKGI